MLILDSHCDTPTSMMRLRDLRKDNKRGHVDIPKLKAGKVDASFFALYTPSETAPDEATANALRMIGAVNDLVSSNSQDLALALSSKDVLKNKNDGRISILLGMENGSPIQKSLSLLRVFHNLGVRYLTLTHNGDNEIGDSAAQGRRWNGLSPFGRDVIAQMNGLGMIVDIAHASDRTFYDVLDVSETPVVSTHSCCRALCGHRRNLSDGMLRSLADKGGVMQINFYPSFLSDRFAETLKASGLEKESCKEAEWAADPSDSAKREEWNRVLDKLAALPRPSVKDVVDHIDHAVKVAGIEHVGIGSDFDGIEVCPEGLENISKIGAVFDEMERRGYSDGQIAKVAGENFLRVMKEVEKFSCK